MVDHNAVKIKFKYVIKTAAMPFGHVGLGSALISAGAKAESAERTAKYT